MSYLNNNNLREDPIFNTKVKKTLLTGGGPYAMVTALSTFALETTKAQTNGQPGLSYEEFLSYLEGQGISLTEFEKNYLCNAFRFREEDKKEYIDAKSFQRHLVGVNYRRMQSIQQCWDRIEKDANGNVSRAVLLNTQANLNATNSNRQFQTTFSRPNLTQSQKSGEGDNVNFSEFLAFYAAVSEITPSDEAFVVQMLQDWNSDKTTAPKLNETNREWGPEGDPLAETETHYVGDALHQNLGVSSKSYDYHHMERTHPPVEPLPPLDREEIMTTTNKKMYPAPDAQDIDLVDPLATRRGQKE